METNPLLHLPLSLLRDEYVVPPEDVQQGAMQGQGFGIDKPDYR